MSIIQQIRVRQPDKTETISTVWQRPKDQSKLTLCYRFRGEIVQCIPCNEISYASNNRNSDTISIECCIEDETGKFNDSTYQSLIELTTWLMGRYDLSADDVIRHYDVTGKKCPLYFVEHEDAWEQFHKDLDTYIEEMVCQRKRQAKTDNIQ